MLRYVALRLAQALAVLFVAFALSFFLLYLVPGDAALARMGQDTAASPERLEALRASMGLDRPWYLAFVSQLAGVATLQFGDSLRNGRPVIEVIASALPSTAQLAGASLIVAVVVGAAVALLATHSRSPWLRSTLLALPVLGVSIPTFWLGILLLGIFSFQLGWFPSFGSGGIDSLVLPVLTLGTVASASVAQVLATSLLDASRSPFAFTAMTKGASRWRMLLAHCLRSASLPVLTMVGLLTGTLLTGSVVTESVFSRAGIGREILSSVEASDFPVVQGIVMVCAMIFVVVNLVVDLLYPLLDPRMRLNGARS